MVSREAIEDTYISQRAKDIYEHRSNGPCSIEGQDNGAIDHVHSHHNIGLVCPKQAISNNTFACL